MNEIYHAWYSEKAETQYGSYVYLDENGRPVVVTSVSRNSETNYNWDDKVYRGTVIRYVGRHLEGSQADKSLTFLKQSVIV